ncbi:hypothetical protein TOPH_04603 [Tolypocladium ophioglossoides CBS 100239]|uniref:Uncharacterized protein n=1 Tax=Tolypocladium ophioglossoides (strain CBS 100239) TaxID=1163406 RepID=A0A0L0N9W7_TOLOC|nr:hypothetical protein TOPH_04603 [Tolypocladium ophioglossoides CBS 100239]
MEDIKVIAWKSNAYTGKALRVAVGVQGYENGFAIISDECPTVGVAGGYTQGGGHSATLPESASAQKIGQITQAAIAGLKAPTCILILFSSPISCRRLQPPSTKPLINHSELSPHWPVGRKNWVLYHIGRG